MISDETVHSNRPDITFMRKKTKNTFLIVIALPNTHNLAKTITDKQNKYHELANEICALWKQNAAQLIPTVMSSTGVIPMSLSQTLERRNLLKPNDIYICRTAALTSRRYILNIYSTNIHTEYFKHAA